MQKSSLMAWVGGTVRANQVLVPSIRCGKAPLSFPLAGAVLPDGDYVVTGILQLDGHEPVLLPLAYTAHSGDAFLRLAGEVVGGKVLQREVGLPDGSFHSQVISWGDRLLLADSRFDAAMAKVPAEPVVQPAAAQEPKPATETVSETVDTPAAAREDKPAAQVSSDRVETPAAGTSATPEASTVTTPQAQAPSPTKASTPAAEPVQGELQWEPSSRTEFSGDELDRVSLTVPMGKTLEWPVTSDPCPPLAGEVGKAIVQAAPVEPEKSVPTLRKARRKNADKVDSSPAAEPTVPPAPVEVAPKVRNLDGLTF